MSNEPGGPTTAGGCSTHRTGGKSPPSGAPEGAKLDASPDTEPATETKPQAPARNHPKDLLNAANAAAGSARNSWLAFMGVIAYLLVTLAGVTHVDLLLNSPVRLPIVNVEIPLFSFFLVAPYLLVMVHLSVLIQHALLARKYQLFSEAIAADEDPRERDHALRQLVNSYVFAQMVAGPRPIGTMRFLMRLMVFATVSLLPIVTLIYSQITFLPVHDVATIHAIRIAVLVDLILLFAVWPLIPMPYLSDGGRLRIARHGWRWEMSYASLTIAGFLVLVVAGFSWLVATVPQACFWPVGEEKVFEPKENACFSLDQKAAEWWPSLVHVQRQRRQVFPATAWLFEGKPDETTGRAKSWFSRNLIVIDTDLVPNSAFEDGDTTLALRGRDLRFASFDRSDLRRADLFDANLRGASVQSANLQHARLERAQLQWTDLRTANLKEATLSEAQMEGARLNGAQMQRVTLDRAQLRKADLRRARMQEANLSRARMQEAYLWGADLKVADLRGAQMQGAHLYMAEMQGADLREAYMQGADLSGAQMQGVILGRALLRNAALGSTQMQGANLTETKIWLTSPPSEADFEAAILRFNFSPPDQTALQETLRSIQGDDVRERVGDSLGRLLDPVVVEAWDDHRYQGGWADMSKRPEPAPNAVASILANLACSDETDGFVIRGLARRFYPNLRYHVLAAAKLVDLRTCPAAKHLDGETMARLKEVAASASAKSEPAKAATPDEGSLSER